MIFPIRSIAHHHEASRSSLVLQGTYSWTSSYQHASVRKTKDTAGPWPSHPEINSDYMALRLWYMLPCLPFYRDSMYWWQKVSGLEAFVDQEYDAQFSLTAWSSYQHHIGLLICHLNANPNECATSFRRWRRQMLINTTDSYLAAVILLPELYNSWLVSGTSGKV